MLAGLLPAGARAETPLPQRNLLVELREADAAQSSVGSGGPGWNIRSGDASVTRAQQVRVLNGASANLRLSTTRPVQVWQTLPGGLWPVAVPGTQWVEAGQRLTVQPRWPGGAAPVDVTLTAESSRFDPTVAPGSTQPPQRSEARVETVLRLPLGEWVTVAATSTSDADRNVISSRQAATSAQRALQMRVSVAP